MLTVVNSENSIFSTRFKKLEKDKHFTVFFKLLVPRYNDKFLTKVLSYGLTHGLVLAYSSLKITYSPLK